MDVAALINALMFFKADNIQHTDFNGKMEEKKDVLNYTVKKMQIIWDIFNKIFSRDI